MIWLLLLILALATGLCLSAPLVKKPGSKISPIGLSLFFAGFIALAIGLYAQIGRPDLLKPGALQAYTPPKGPNAEDMRAAQQMSPEERAEMILSMVESLAARLEDTPEDAEGWKRLLRSRQVLGQAEQLEKDLAKLPEIFKNNPETLADILKDAGLDSR